MFSFPFSQNLTPEALVKMTASTQSRVGGAPSPHPHRHLLQSRPPRSDQQKGTNHAGQSLPRCTMRLTGGSTPPGLLPHSVRKAQMVLANLMKTHNVEGQVHVVTTQLYGQRH